MYLVLVILLLSGCSSTASGSSGTFSSSSPTDDEVTKVIMNNLSATNVVIQNKQQCQQTANQKVEGDERWVITFDGTNNAGYPATQYGTTKITVRKRDDSTWVWFSALADCGR